MKQALQVSDMNKDQLLEEIRNWQTTEEDINDVMHRYFEKTEFLHWCQISEEGNRLFEEISKEKVETYSAIDALIAGIAAQASNGVYIALANALGWNAQILMFVLDHWISPDKNGNYKKNTVTIEELKTLYEEELEYSKKSYIERLKNPRLPKDWPKD